jgi:hypothetical protein
LRNIGKLIGQLLWLWNGGLNRSNDNEKCYTQTKDKTK